MIYYIDPVTGSDSNSGTKPSTPFASFTPLSYNGTYPNRRVLHFGDTISLKKGTTIYDKFMPFLGIANGDATYRPPVILRSYGNGKKPIISNAKVLASDGFVNGGSNIWSIDMSNLSYFTGYLATDSHAYNIGYLFDDRTETLYGKRVTTTGELVEKGQFCVSGNTLYVYGTETPYNFITKIIGRNANDALVTPINNMVIYDIEFTECGSHGIKTSITNGFSNISVRNCRFKNLGGSLWSGTTRLGNGVEIFGSANDIEVCGNEFINIYDTATTTQGNDSVYKNVSFHHNIMRDCTNSFEVWCDNNIADPNVGYNGVYFYKNIVINGGKGFGGGRANSGDLIIGQGGTCDLKKIEVRDNIFAFPAVRVFTPNSNIGVIKNNRIYGSSTITLDSTYSLNNVDAYITAMNNHKNTKTQVINNDNSMELHTVLTSLNTEMSLILAESKDITPPIPDILNSISLVFTGGSGTIVKSEYLGNGYCELWFTYTPAGDKTAWTTFVSSDNYRSRPSAAQIALSALFGNTTPVLNVFQYAGTTFQGFYGQANAAMTSGTPYTFHGIFKTTHA